MLAEEALRFVTAKGILAPGEVSSLKPMTAGAKTEVLPPLEWITSAITPAFTSGSTDISREESAVLFALLV